MENRELVNNLTTHAAMEFPPEKLNYFRLVTTSCCMEKVMHDLRENELSPSANPKNDDGIQGFRKILCAKNGVKEECCADCVDPFGAILEAEVNGCSSYELYVNPPPNGKFHDSFEGLSGDSIKTMALAIDQLRLLRNEIKTIKTEMIDKETFDYYIQLTKKALNALRQDTSVIDDIVLLSEKDFPADKVQQLRKSLETENCCAKQIKHYLINEFRSEDDSSGYHSVNREELNESLLSTGSASSLNSFPPSPCDPIRATSDFSFRGSPTEEASIKVTENAYQEDYASARPLCDSSTKLQADFGGMSSNEKGLLSKEDHSETETVTLVDHQRDQEFKQSKQPNCKCTYHQSNDITVRQLQDRIQDLLHKLEQLQAENTFYIDRCLNQEVEIAQLKENLTQIEEEKQGLESEVGRQLFLEGKNKRHSKLYQPFTEHVGEQIIPNTASGASFHVTGLDGEQLDIAGPCDNSGTNYFYVGETLCTISVYRK